MNEVRKLPILLAALTLSSAFLALMPEAAASNHDDVRVYDITIHGNHPVVERWTAVTAHLRNVGDDDEQVDVKFFWRPKGGSENVLEGERFRNTTGPCAGQFDSMKRSINVPRKGEAQVTLCWIPSDTQAVAGGEGTLRVEASQGLVTGTGTAIANKTKPFKIQYPDVKLETEWRELAPEDINKRCDPNVDRQLIDCRVRPEQTVAFDVKLENTGNYPDTYRIETVNCISKEPATTGSWKVETTADELYVLNDTGDGSNRHVRYITLYATPDKKAKAGSQLHDGMSLCLRAKSQSADLPRADETVYYPVLPVERVHNINLSNHRPRVYGLVNNPIELNASIHNAGNEDDYYKVEFVPPTPGNPWNVTRSWELDLKPTNQAGAGRGVLIKADNRTDATFYVTPPENTTRGWYNLTMKWYTPEGVNSTFDSAESRDFITYKIRVNQTYKLRTDPVQPETLARLAPARTAEYQLTVHNDGNGPDNLTWTVQNVPGRWTWTLDGTDGNQIRLAPFENRTLTFRVTTPPGEEKDKESAMFVNLTSEGPKNAAVKEQVSFRTRLQVLERSNFEATTDGTTPFLDPGEKHTFTVTLRNVGNRYDNFTADISPQDISPHGWKASVEPSTPIYLAPLGKRGAPHSATVRVTLEAPDTAEVGEIGNAILTIASTEDPDVKRSLDFEARVSGPEVSISDVRTRKPLVYQGESNHVLVSYVNNGNLDARNVTLKVELRPANGNPVGLDTRVLPVVAKRSTTTIEIPFDFSDLAGEATLVAVIDPDDTLKEIDDANNEKRSNLFIRTWDVSLEGTPQGLTARPGERVAYLDVPNAFVIRNSGNRDEPLTVTLTSAHDWLVKDSTLCKISNPVIIPAGSSRTFCAELRVPDRPGTHADRLTFHATSDHRPGVTLTARVNTTLLDETPPVIADFQANPSPALVGEPVEISATLTDAIGVKRVVASLKRANEETQEVLELAPAGGDKWAVQTVFDRTGEVLIRLTATDASPNGNVNTTRLNFLNLQVQAASSPDVKVTVPESRTLRAGTQIPVEVADRYEIARVWYVANGVTGRDLAEPYKIDTSNWKDGTYRVLLYAENVHGMRSVSEFNLTVDNRVPDKPDVTLSDDRIKPGEAITVTIRTETRVDEVKVIVKRDGVPVGNETARRVRDGVFELEYTPTTAGSYTFDVVVRDAIGNERPVPSAAAFTASSSPIPGAGALGALAALGLAGARRLGRRDR